MIAVLAGAAVVAAFFILRKKNVSLKIPRLVVAAVAITVSAIFYLLEREAIGAVQGMMYSPFDAIYFMS